MRRWPWNGRGLERDGRAVIDISDDFRTRRVTVVMGHGIVFNGNAGPHGSFCVLSLLQNSISVWTRNQKYITPELSYLSLTHTISVVNFLGLIRSDESF